VKKVVKTKGFCIFFLGMLLALGCAAPPKKERTKLPSQWAEPAKPHLPAEEKLEELVVPQREGAKKVPEKRYSLFARDANVQDVLLAFSRKSELNIVIDPQLRGTATIDLKRVSLRDALETILSPLGWSYRINGKFVEILRPKMESRLFTLNYIVTKRRGKREVVASTGGSMPTSAFPGQQTQSESKGYSDLVSVDEMDLWKDIHRGLETIIFGSIAEQESGATEEIDKMAWTRRDEKGKQLIINKSSGVIWVTDYPSNLNKVALFLETIEGSAQRQVTIQAKIMEVILSDGYEAGINWKVIQGLPRSMNLAWGLTDRAGTTGFPGAIGGSGETTDTISTPGLFKIMPFGGILSIGASGTAVALSDIMQWISEQGDVKILSSPTLSTLNNQKAIIRVGDQDVFFISGAVSTEIAVTQTIQPVTIDVGIILDVTPQIAEDGTIIMNIHPSISEKTGEKVTPDGKSTFPLLSVRETDTTVRVRDGQTIIIAGLMYEKKEETYTGIPVLQSIPLLGGLFRYKTEKKRKSELVIMITPTVHVGKKMDVFVQH
jgi:MSHA type pilus biogenesis protein MshL